MENLEKIAQENANLAEEIAKIASEEVLEMSEEDLLNEFVSELEAEGYDINDEDTINEIQKILDETPEQIGDYAVEKVAEYISEDILKVASGATGFETEAASRAVANYFDLHGAANLGSPTGMSAVGVGSAISPNADKNVMGGFGKLIGGNAMFPNNVNATTKVQGVLSNVYRDNIRTASDEDYLEAFIEHIENAAQEENQSVDDFVKDLGYEYLEEIGNELLTNN